MTPKIWISFFSLSLRHSLLCMFLFFSFSLSKFTFWYTFTDILTNRYSWHICIHVSTFFSRIFYYQLSSHQYESSISDISCFKFIWHFWFYSSTHSVSWFITFSEHRQAFTSQSFKLWLWMWQSPSLALFHWTYLYWSLRFD